MIYKLLGWSFLIVFIVYRLDIEKKREPYRNKELKDYGVGTFAVFNTQTIKNDENEDDEDYSHLDKQKILEYVNNLKIDRENKFNEYIALQQSGNISNYTKQLENEIEIVDLNIAKFDRIYYKISISEHNTKENIIPKYNKENDETLFKFPMGNLLPVSDNRNLFENRIQSFDTNIKMINKNTVAYELDNEIFTNEFKNMINKDKKNYYDELIDFEKIYDDDDDEDKEKVDETNEEQKGQLRKKKYENVSKKDIDLFNKIEKRVLKDINNNSEFTIGQRSDKFIVVQKKMNYILYNVKNTRELVYDGDIVIYRNLKNHGKHIGFKVLIQNNNIYIIDLKIKGIVTEDKIHMYISSNEFENNLVYYEYDDKYVMTINPREDEVNNMSYMDKIRIMRNRKNALRLDRGLR